LTLNSAITIKNSTISVDATSLQGVLGEEVLINSAFEGLGETNGSTAGMGSRSLYKKIKGA
jgi:hypothetical protein